MARRRPRTAMERRRPRTPPSRRLVVGRPDTLPQLLCPGCDRPLEYRQTMIGAVKPIERWDYFECRACGTFAYHDRTRKVDPTT